MIRAVVVWIAGLLTIVPYSVYYLFMRAERDQYAALITVVLFWIFGYWGIVGPILAALKARAVLGAIERAPTQERLTELLRSGETRDVAIDLIASEHRVPRFLAAWVYRRVVDRGIAAMNSGQRAGGADPPGASSRRS